MLEFALGSQASSTALSDRNTATGIPEKHCAMYAVSQYEPQGFWRKWGQGHNTQKLCPRHIFKKAGIQKKTAAGFVV